MDHTVRPEDMDQSFPVGPQTGDGKGNSQRVQAREPNAAEIADNIGQIANTPFPDEVRERISELFLEFVQNQRTSHYLTARNEAIKEEIDKLNGLTAIHDLHRCDEGHGGQPGLAAVLARMQGR